ncbi:hypothetical protein ACG7TL_001337 [Trametes sanguinea]
MLQVAQNQDLLTEQLIARLLEDDLQDMENARAAEALQLSETFRVSALAAGRFPKNVQAVKTDPSDEDLAMEVLAAEIIASKDALIAQELQHAEESDLTASRQYAQKLAAAERKCALDAEFAKRLQDAFDDGNDDLNMDAESVLGQHTIEDIMASDLNDKGKGKGKGKGNVSVKMEVDHHAPPPSYMETNLNCEEYQALPLDDRSPEDQDALRLIKAENWRRCPNCSFIVELTHGCNHITCRCKTEFCFKCGSLWDVRNKQCSREPSCELWDETMLLEERERERERAGAYRGIQPVAPPARHAAPPRPVAPRRRGQSLDWMDDPDILCMRHWVTRDMISSLTCVYCDAKLNSLADLRYHLAHVRRHAVYACCGRFFKREEDFDRHVESEPVRFGFHLHTFQRD